MGFETAANQLDLPKSRIASLQNATERLLVPRVGDTA